MNAFPKIKRLASDRHGGFDVEYESEGLTARDFFAAAALQGMLAANAANHPEVNDRNVDAVIAREAYASADAMMWERQKPIVASYNPCFNDADDDEAPPKK